MRNAASPAIIIKRQQGVSRPGGHCIVYESLELSQHAWQVRDLPAFLS